MKLILFDFDGVLVDTLPIAFAINKEAQPDLLMEEYISFFEGNIHDAVASGRKKEIPDFGEKYSLRARELKIPETFKELIKNLASRYILTIVSSSRTHVIEEILERDDVSQYFLDILGSDAHKSKVVKIKNLLEKHKATPEDSVFVTDTLGDIREAEECNVKSIAVSWGFHSVETLEKGRPARIVNTPADLLKAVEEILC